QPARRRPPGLARPAGARMSGDPIAIAPAAADDLPALAGLMAASPLPPRYAPTHGAALPAPERAPRAGDPLLVGRAAVGAATGVGRAAARAPGSRLSPLARGGGGPRGPGAGRGPPGGRGAGAPPLGQSPRPAHPPRQRRRPPLLRAPRLSPRGRPARPGGPRP